MRCGNPEICDMSLFPLFPLVTPKCDDIYGPRKYQVCPDGSICDRKGKLGSIATDVLEYEDKFLVVADLPGVVKDDVKISTEERVLSINVATNNESQTCSQSAENSGKNPRYHLRDRKRYDSLQVHLSFPDTANFEQVSASLENGILTLEIQKRIDESKKKREIYIQ